jgi:hypothetical protein
MLTFFTKLEKRPVPNTSSKSSILKIYLLWAHILTREQAKLHYVVFIAIVLFKMMISNQIEVLLLKESNLPELPKRSPIVRRVHDQGHDHDDEYFDYLRVYSFAFRNQRFCFQT